MAAIYRYYLDASALVKLVSDEPGSKVLRNFYSTSRGASATTFAFIEALRVLKRKWLKNLADPAYAQALESLHIDVFGGKLELDTISMADPSTFKSVSDLALANRLDFGDALQLHAIGQGKYSVFSAGSKTKFISADGDLVKAARCLGINTWNCSNDNPEHWA